MVAAFGDLEVAGNNLLKGNMGNLVCVRDECVCMVMVLSRPRVFSLCV